MAQLYNRPLDMLIERQIETRHPVLRFAQIQAVAVLLEEAVRGSSSPEIVRLVPRRILHASRFLNACYAASSTSNSRARWRQACHSFRWERWSGE
jgi:hypothetical protein